MSFYCPEFYLNTLELWYWSEIKAHQVKSRQVQVEFRTGTYWILLDKNAPGFYLIGYQVKLSKIQEHVQLLMHCWPIWIFCSAAFLLVLGHYNCIGSSKCQSYEPICAYCQWHCKLILGQYKLIGRYPPSVLGPYMGLVQFPYMCLVSPYEAYTEYIFMGPYIYMHLSYTMGPHQLYRGIHKIVMWALPSTMTQICIMGSSCVVWCCHVIEDDLVISCNDTYIRITMSDSEGSRKKKRTGWTSVKAVNFVAVSQPSSHAVDHSGWHLLPNRWSERDGKDKQAKNTHRRIRTHFLEMHCRRDLKTLRACPAHLPKKISCPYCVPRGKLAVRCTLLWGVGKEFPWGSPIKLEQRKYPFISFDSLLQWCLNRDWTCILS